MDGGDISRVVQRKIALAGVEGDFAGHGLRAGFNDRPGAEEYPQKSISFGYRGIGRWRCCAGTCGGRLSSRSCHLCQFLGRFGGRTLSSPSTRSFVVPESVRGPRVGLETLLGLRRILELQCQMKRQLHQRPLPLRPRRPRNPFRLRYMRAARRRGDRVNPG
jgi:hypothetical protein